MEPLAPLRDVPLADTHQVCAGLRTRPLETLCYLRDTFGDAVRLAVGAQSWVLLSHPEAMKEVLLRQRESFIKPPLLALARELMGDGLVTAEDRVHRDIRPLLNQAFQRTALSAHVARMQPMISEAVGTLRDGEEIDLSLFLRRLTLSVIGAILFGIDFERAFVDERDALLHHAAIATMCLRPFQPQIEDLSAFRQAKQCLDQTVDALIEHGRSAGCGDNLLAQMVMLGVEDSACPLARPKQLHDEVITLLLAGHETTAHALEWTWWWLSREADVRTAFHQEIDQIRAGDLEGAFCDLLEQGVTYTKRVLWESMRLRPPVWIMGRQVGLKPVSVLGVTLEPGTAVALSQWLNNHDGQTYPGPDRFDPNRFRDPQGFTPPPPLLPFGTGPRRCIGDRLSTAESLAILVLTGRLCAFDLLNGDEVAADAGFTLKPLPNLYARVRLR